VKEILSIDDPRFENFLDRLEGHLEQCRNEIIEKANKRRKIPPGVFTKDADGNLLYEVSIPPEEKNKIVRKALEETGDLIDIEGTIKFLQTIDGFCDCEDCKKVLDLIKTDEGSA
jgi:hypothetical protein